MSVSVVLLLLSAACGEVPDRSRARAGDEPSPVEVAAKQGWGHLYAKRPVAVRGLGVARGSTAVVGFGQAGDDPPPMHPHVQGSIVEHDAVSGRERRRRIVGGGYWELYAGVSDGKSVAYLVRRCDDPAWMDMMFCGDEHFTVDVGPVDGDVLSVSMPLPGHSYQGVALRDGMVAALHSGSTKVDESTGITSVVTAGVTWSEVGSPPRWSELAPLDSPMSFGSSPCATGDGVVWAREGLPDGNMRLRRFQLGSQGWSNPVGPVLGVRSLVACGPDQAYVSVPESNSLWRLPSRPGAEPEALELPGKALTRGEGGSLYDSLCVDAVDGTLYMRWRPSFRGDDSTTLWPRDSTTPTRTVPHPVICPVAGAKYNWHAPTDDPPTLVSEPL